MSKEYKFSILNKIKECIYLDKKIPFELIKELADLKEYTNHEFCKAVECRALSQNSEGKVFCLRKEISCVKSALHFHNYLKESYKIVKEK